MMTVMTMTMIMVVMMRGSKGRLNAPSSALTATDGGNLARCRQYMKRHIAFDDDDEDEEIKRISGCLDCDFQ